MPASASKDNDQLAARDSSIRALRLRKSAALWFRSPSKDSRDTVTNALPPATRSLALASHFDQGRPLRAQRPAPTRTSDDGCGAAGSVQVPMTPLAALPI